MNKNIKKTFNSFIEKIKSNKKLQFGLICVLLAFIVFIFIFDFKKTENASNTSNDQIINYVNSLESKLSNTLSKVDGAGKVSLIITVESGMETILASKTTTKEHANGEKEIETAPIVVNGKTIVVKQMYPKIIGVLIVAEGAKNISVMNKLQQATISLLDININQIEILSMN